MYWFCGTLVQSVFRLYINFLAGTDPKCIGFVGNFTGKFILLRENIVEKNPVLLRTCLLEIRAAHDAARDTNSHVHRAPPRHRKEKEK